MTSFLGSFFDIKDKRKLFKKAAIYGTIYLIVYVTWGEIGNGKQL